MGYSRAVGRRRDELSFLLWGAGWWLAHAGGARTVPMTGGAAGAAAAGLWALLLAGVGLRLWAAMNLEKNRFDRPAGPYCLMRHPLYAGTSLISLSFFLSLGTPVAGSLLWIAMVGGIFVPVMRREERQLSVRFPEAYGAYLRRVPALYPRVSALPEAVRTSAASLDRARRNYGLRALVFLPLVPALGALLRWANGAGSP